MTKVLDLAYGEKKEDSYNIRTAMEEASRCLLCYDAPCSEACPAKTDPGKFIRSLRFKNVKGAAETIRENNPLGGSCSLICPHAKLCEEACSRSGIDKPIQIGKLQEYAVEQERIHNMQIVKKPEITNGKKVACIGSGPASLTCASVLAREGYEVVVFEKEEKPGGILTYGINPSRIDQDIVDYDISLIENQGVKIICNKNITREDLEKMKLEYDAIHVGVGLGESNIIASDEIDIDLEGVNAALEFLKDARTGKIKSLENEDILIIGGGDVAMDCALTAHQLGANTKIVYRRSISEAPANIEELRMVQDMGIAIITEFSPLKTIEEDSKLSKVMFKSRDNLSEMTLKADKLIFAIGQKRDNEYLDFKENENIFASGDLVNDGATVVQAVKEGKEVAKDIMKYISQKEDK
ncbi:MAG TPA: FAD-dependent oxidoreductase [Tissierellaceae bacterium]